MNKYNYKARNKQGETVQGTLMMENKELAIASLRQQGLLVTQLKEAPKSSFSQLTLFEESGPLKVKLLAVFCRQFAILLEAGLSLVACLELLEEQSSNKRLAKALREMRLDITSGTSFTNAVEKHKDLFPHEFIHLTEAGELAGELPEVFNQLAVYYEREDELRKKVSEALMYPAIIGIVAVVMVLVLLFVVLPMLISNFASFGVETPIFTQMVLNFRDLVVQYWYLTLGSIVGFVLLVRWYLKTEKGKYQKDYIALKIPVLGNLNRMVIFSRFCRVLGLLLGSGISMVRSLETVTRLVENKIISQELYQSRLAVERGQGLTEPIRNSKWFPAMLIQMVAVGEETGNLEDTLEHLSNYYDKEVNFAVAAFTKVLEPIVMLVLGVVVLFILASVYMPMMQMVGQL